MTKALNKVIQQCKHATHALRITSRKIYLIQIYKHNCFNISDVQDVENNPLVGMLAILKHNESVFFSTISFCRNSDLLHIRFVFI